MSRFDLFGNPLDDRRISGRLSGEEPTYAEHVRDLGQNVEEDTSGRTFPGLTLWIIGTLFALGAQCFHLQITLGSQNRALAEGNVLRTLKIPAERGLIVDFNGAVLAHNTRKLALAINPQTLPVKKAERQKVYDALKKKAGIDQKTISFIEDTGRLSPDIFAIKTDLSQDDSLLYEEWFADTPGVTIQEVPIRSYASLPSFGQLVGYVGQANSQADLNAGFKPDDRIGKTGLEEVYNQDLMGTAGHQKAEVNAQGEIVRTLPESGDSQAKPGDTLKLSLDTSYQSILAGALQNGIDARAKALGTAKTKSLGASGVILDPKTGAVKAMVSLPDYDSNLFASGISQTAYQELLNNPADPLLNRAIQGLYPSGSTVKPLVAAAALQAGIIDNNKFIDTPDAIYVGTFRFPDWKIHGRTNLSQAIAQSNDIFFYALGGGYQPYGIKGLGIDALDKGLQQFGLGSPTGIDLPGEEAGAVPGPDWKQKNVGEPWYIGDTYHQSIGQGYLLVTPLQMAVATAAIANGGTLYQPQLAWSLVDPTTNKETPLPHKVINQNWISQASLAIVRQGMRQTTLPGGTGQLIGKLNVTSAGKTGTAEFGSEGLTHSWYVGYAPADNPTIAFAILLEGDGNVSEATEGSETVVEEMLRGVFNQPLQPGQSLFTAPLLPQGAANTAPATPSPTPNPTPTPATR